MLNECFRWGMGVATGEKGLLGRGGLNFFFLINRVLR